MALTSDPPDIVQTTRFGYSAVVGDAEMMVWPVGSGYIYPTSPTEMHISSTISLDTDGDTGAHVIAVIGLDGNYVEQTEFVTMSGHLQNPTSTQFWRVFNLEVQSAGSNGKNVGMIFAATSGATDGLPNSELFARIESGDNSTHMPLYTIPASYQGELETWWGATMNNCLGVDLSIYIRPDSGAPFRLLDRRKLHANAGLDHDYT